VANFQDYGITHGGAAQVNVQAFTIACRVEEDDTTVIADYTGENALVFPSVLSTLTEEQRRQIVDAVAQTIVLMRAGLL
jgi:hypothetical protein